jgi:alpha(1,3/1,4) fucosyltransferase
MEENFTQLDNEATLEICPETKKDLKVRVINQWNNTVGEFKVFFDVLAEDFNLIEVSDDSYNLVLNGLFDNKPITNPNAVRLYFMGEAFTPPIQYHHLSMGFNHYDADNYLRFPLYYLYFKNNVTTEYERGECNPNKPYFACFLASNNNPSLDGVLERVDTFLKLSEYKFVISGGKTLNNIGYYVAQNETKEFLSQCKFTIAYENTARFPGYITEKVFQAYFAGSIPIYHTHNSALQDINTKAAIIQNLYPSKQDMINHIIALDQDDEKYCQMWNEKIVIDPKVNYPAALARFKEKIRKILSY